MTQVGKAKLDHPALSTAGGAPLHAAIETIYENISNHLPARWQLFESVAAGGSVTFEHGFQVPLADLRVHVYIKGASSNTKVADLGAAGWSVVATSGFAQTKLDVTAPSSGGPFDFYLYVSHEPMDDKISISGGTMTGSLVLTSDPTYPSQDLHAATKGYVDAVAQGLSPKQVVKAATTANIGLSGTMTIDGVAVIAGDRVLVKDQTTASQNGIYVVGAGAWSRASDMDAWTEVPGSYCFVEKGTANADKGYVCTADSGGTVGSTAITWVRFTGVEALEVDGVTLDKASGTLKVKDGGIGNTQIAASAAIADSKLAKITTAGKVSGDAITDGTIGGTASISTTGTAAFNGTSHLKLPVGNNDQRPSPASSVNGMIRYNSQVAAYEGYNDGNWKSIGGGSTVARVFSVNVSGTVYGDIARMDGMSLAKADATSSNNAEVLGIVTKVYSNTYDRDITGGGEVANLTAANFAEAVLPAMGSVVFLSTTPGLMSVNEPTVIGQVSVPLGVVTWSDPGAGVCTVNFAPKRGVVVGGANARTQVSFLNNTSGQDVQNVSAYEAGELAGWVFIDATTDLRFYVQAQFVKAGNNNYSMSYQVAGDTPPSGFALTMSNAGLIEVNMPNVAGFSAGYMNYALNAPAVGTNFPLSIDASAVVSGTPTFDTVNERTLNNGVQIQGRKSGVTIPSGYVGERIIGTKRTVTTAAVAYVTGSTSCITLNKGIYLMFVKGDWLANNTASVIGFGVSSTPTTRTPIDSIFNEGTPSSYNGALASLAVTTTTDSSIYMAPPFYLVVPADSTQYYPTVYSEDQTGLIVGINMAAIRIA